MKEDRCCYPGCESGSDIIYLGKPLCDHHWNMVDTAPAKLRRSIGLPETIEKAPAAPLPPGARKAMGIAAVLRRNRRA